ncbi:MAG: M15 family metallopeptidase [Treponema sp.]|nr:M15 family metallopeptidase [Treponema sp.]
MSKKRRSKAGAIMLVFAAGMLVLIFACRKSVQDIPPQEINESSYVDLITVHILDVLSNSQLPEHISGNIQENMAESPDFIFELFTILQKDPFLWKLVDKKNSLGSGYEPYDLVDLRSGSYGVVSNRMLRRAAYNSLQEMQDAARSERLTLTVLSAYRSHLYQGRVYTYNVITMGQKEADRESARPGYSQHQLGLAADFNSLENAFAKTPEGIWLANNASRFGWSLSYPDGYEDVTGYMWESWHYRYVGKELTGFIDNYFDGIQQYALQFIHNIDERLDRENLTLGWH